jgi:hypothetical protein
MSDSFKRRVKRNQMAATLLATARAHGCTCDPDIDFPTPEPGQLRVATIAHDHDCPLATTRAQYDTPAIRATIAHINAGEHDRPEENR